MAGVLREAIMLELVLAGLLGAALGAGGAVALTRRSDAPAVEAAADVAEATAGAVEAAQAPEVAEQQTVQAVIAQDPAHWFCGDGEMADPLACMTLLCWQVNMANPTANQAARTCGDLAAAYVERLEREP